MTLLTPPFVLQNSSHGAELFRDAIGSFLSSAGIVTAGDLALTQKSTPNMSVELGAGQVWVKATTAGAGYYYTRNTAALNLAVSASSPSNPRCDAVVIRVKDQGYEGSENEVVAEVRAGTAEAGVTLANKKSAPGQGGGPALPNSCIVVGYILVPANATTIVTANIENTVALALSALSTSGSWESIPGMTLTAIKPIQVRVENGNVVRFRGLGEATAKANAGSTLGTLGAALRPPTGHDANLTAATEGVTAVSNLVQLNITSAGVISNIVAIQAGEKLCFDGLTFSTV